MLLARQIKTKNKNHLKMQIDMKKTNVLQLTYAITLILTLTFLLGCNTNNSTTNLSVKEKTNPSVKEKTKSINHVLTSESIDTICIVLKDIEQQLILAVNAATPPKRSPNE